MFTRYRNFLFIHPLFGAPRESIRKAAAKAPREAAPKLTKEEKIWKSALIKKLKEIEK